MVVSQSEAKVANPASNSWPLSDTNAHGPTSWINCYQSLSWTLILPHHDDKPPQLCHKSSVHVQKPFTIYFAPIKTKEDLLCIVTNIWRSHRDPTKASQIQADLILKRGHRPVLTQKFLNFRSVFYKLSSVFSGRNFFLHKYNMKALWLHGAIC